MSSIARKSRKMWNKPAYREKQIRGLASLMRDLPFTEPNLCRVLALMRIEYNAIVPVPNTNGMVVLINLKHGAGHLQLDHKELMRGGDKKEVRTDGGESATGEATETQHHVDPGTVVRQNPEGD